MKGLIRNDDDDGDVFGGPRVTVCAKCVEKLERECVMEFPFWSDASFLFEAGELLER